MSEERAEETEFERESCDETHKPEEDVDDRQSTVTFTGSQRTPSHVVLTNSIVSSDVSLTSSIRASVVNGDPMNIDDIQHEIQHARWLSGRPIEPLLASTMPAQVLCTMPRYLASLPCTHRPRICGACTRMRGP